MTHSEIPLQVFIEKYKKQEEKLSLCLRENGCMGVGSCPKGKNPINCKSKKDIARSNVDSLSKAIPSSGTGRASIGLP